MLVRLIEWVWSLRLHKFIHLMYFNFSALCALMQKTHASACALWKKNSSALEFYMARASECCVRRFVGCIIPPFAVDADTFDVLLITPVPIILFSQGVFDYK